MTSIHKAALFAATFMVTAMIVLPPSVWSDTVGLLNTFHAGETARALDVNENFDAVEEAVDGNDALIAALEARIEELENDVGVPGPQGDEGPQGEQGPAGEGISDSPKIAFVTSEEFDGNLGGLAGADAKCQNAATTAGLDGSWKAWVSVDTNSVPAARFAFPARGYETIDGRFLGGTNFDTFPEEILNPLDVDENGQAVVLGNTFVWTGIESRGRATSSCIEWTSNSNADDGATGTTSGTSTNWTQAISHVDCSNVQHLYCFEQ